VRVRRNASVEECRFAPPAIDLHTTVRPESGPGFQVKVLTTSHGVPPRSVADVSNDDCNRRQRLVHAGIRIYGDPMSSRNIPDSARFMLCQLLCVAC